ncbi:MAG: hypothetical protein RL186_851, partial [Pseudomonadota bacterium]
LLCRSMIENSALCDRRNANPSLLALTQQGEMT